jgi:predicted dithiol-disulfide oxidoreductase (DUF899 family)
MLESHKIVSHREWIEARRELLQKEKEFTRLRDQLSQWRRDLPWERVENIENRRAPTLDSFRPKLS